MKHNTHSTGKIQDSIYTGDHYLWDTGGTENKVGKSQRQEVKQMRQIRKSNKITGSIYSHLETLRGRNTK